MGGLQIKLPVLTLELNWLILVKLIIFKLIKTQLKLSHGQKSSSSIWRLWWILRRSVRLVHLAQEMQECERWAHEDRQQWQWHHELPWIQWILPDDDKHQESLWRSAPSDSNSTQQDHNCDCLRSLLHQLQGCYFTLKSYIGVKISQSYSLSQRYTSSVFDSFPYCEKTSP